MVDESPFFISRQQRVAAWLVHLFTASGAVLGLLTLYAIHQGQFLIAFWWMAGAIIVDAVDGVLARRAKTKVAAPKVDGGLLDNLLDYVNYVMAPAFFLVVHEEMLPPGWRLIGASIIVLVSAYQFTQPEAKTEDHFFKGFPSYWNIVVFYLFIWQTSPRFNLTAIFVLALLTFIPIKYVYPSRLDYLSRSRWLRRGMMLVTILWGVVTAILLWIYPETNPLLVSLSVAYILIYVVISLYRTIKPVNGDEP
jgi:phosphatidylcholine synthase